MNNSIVAIERNGKVDLPKGHIEKNEQDDIAAMREVEEETGLKAKVLRCIFFLAHYVVKLFGTSRHLYKKALKYAMENKVVIPENQKIQFE